MVAFSGLRLSIYSLRVICVSCNDVDVYRSRRPYSAHRTNHTVLDATLPTALLLTSLPTTSRLQRTGRAYDDLIEGYDDELFNGIVAYCNRHMALGNAHLSGTYCLIGII